jgi:hypothetical protein
MIAENRLRLLVSTFDISLSFINSRILVHEYLGFHPILTGYRNRVFKKKLGFKNHILLRWSRRLEILGGYKHGAPLERKNKAFASVYTGLDH